MKKIIIFDTFTLNGILTKEDIIEYQLKLPSNYEIHTCVCTARIQTYKLSGYENIGSPISYTYTKNGLIQVSLLEELKGCSRMIECIALLNQRTDII